MKSKTIYWIAVSLFAALILADGIGGITRQKEGQEVMRHLGYPIYFMVISGIGKLLAVIAILQTRYTTIKEWAYAGLAINFVGAFGSRAFVGDGVFETIFPLLMLGVMFIPYFLWRRIGYAKI